MNESVGLSRRGFLGRAAVVGGALVWAVPMVELLDTSHAFAASGSGVTPPPPPPNPKPVKPMNPPGTLPVTVQGETFTAPVTAPGSATTGTAGTGSTGKTTSVLGTSTTASLPFTGSTVPVKAALEAGAGLLAGGVVLRTLGARRSALAAEQAPPPDGEL